jgi:2-methylcitrate dehydratase
MLSRFVNKRNFASSVTLLRT